MAGITKTTARQIKNRDALPNIGTSSNEQLDVIFEKIDTNSGILGRFPFDITASPAIPEITQITTVADVAGSLNNTYFQIDDPANLYYIWYSVAGLGTDPAIAGRIGIGVSINADATAEDIASITRNTLNKVADFSASSVGSTIIVTNIHGGEVTDIVDAGTGFNFTVTQQGVDSGDLTVHIGSASIQHPVTERHINSRTAPDFAGGVTITFPSVTGGAVVVNPTSAGGVPVLNVDPGNYIKVLFEIDEAGLISAKYGVQNGVINNATIPSFTNERYPIGYIELYNNAGTIQNIENDDIHQFEPGTGIEDVLKIQEVDGSPVSNDVRTMRFPAGTVTEVADGIVEVDINTTRITDDNGNLTVQLKPVVKEFILQAPDTTKWQFTVSNLGEIVATSGAGGDVSLYKITRPDGVEVSFSVDNSGEIQAVSPADPSAVSVDAIYLEAPEGTMWELTVNNSDVIATVDDATWNNRFKVINDKNKPLFQVREYPTDDAAITSVNRIEKEDLSIKLKPEITDFILRSPDSTLWRFTVTDTGTIQSTNVGVHGDETNIKIKRPDGNFVSFETSNSGALSVVYPADPSAYEIDNLFLESSGEYIWKVQVSNVNIITTLDGSTILGYNFQIKNAKNTPLFEVKEVAQDAGALAYVKIISTAQLASISPPPTVTGLAPIAMYDTGSGIRLIYFDTFDATWKYMNDNSAV